MEKLTHSEAIEELYGIMQMFEHARADKLPGSDRVILAIARGIDSIRAIESRLNSEGLEADKRRLDWLESNFGKWHQGLVISRMNDVWKCDSGFHSGDTLRAAIDAASTPPAPTGEREGGGKA